MMESHNLRRFVDAQHPVYDGVRAELRQGAKSGHWMWFIFPQIAGLGSSATARSFAIASREEAAAYLAHPILGARLRECAALVNSVERRSARQIFGAIDELKFRSCMTLFAAVAPDDRVFADALDKYFGGRPDALTLAKL
jgi:uncharacterized protein (DUF1810 family)